ncbi:hypothetical protein BBH88_05945 [Planococcus antarcticus DSM 14505]|uniref:Transcriptional regulator n=1 Tax=Planococcus antarcticus DSM 14505 TaxID=1185653 RepID=A0ABM6D393_9BACL|nr:hypothetical protein [Planococcus antarcticus]ANU09871.1 hypothetical protein BBH88_05945 [Planococcus antarcticus DSM 14505]
MKVRIGAIGPADSLKVIREVADNDPRIELIEFKYFDQEELTSILNKHRYDVAKWIFSGPTPYHYCLELGLITPDEASFPPLHGMALLGTCLKVMQDYGRFVEKMSLDTVNEHVVHSLFSEYQLNNISFELSSFKGYTDHNELIDFHVSNYRAGKSELALTCLLKVYLELKRLGIPVYRVVPSRMAIKTIFDILFSKAQSHVYEKQKVAIIGVDLFYEGRVSKKTVFSFEENRKVLELQQELLRLTKMLNGSLIDKGSGTYFIYTTQGDYELLTFNNTISFIAEEINMRTSLQFHIGIGTGYTIYDAEQHVQLAFEYASSKEDCKVAFVNEDQVFTNLTDLKFSYESNYQLPEYWRNVLKNHKYKETIPAKIYHYVKLKNLSRFTSEVTTTLLKNTDRNTRRILNEMEQMGLIRIVAEEKNLGKPGRPKKVYELVIEEKVK